MTARGRTMWEHAVQVLKQNTVANTITISERAAKSILWALLLAALCLCLISFVTLVLIDFNLKNNEAMTILLVDREHNIPTWFSSSLLLLCSVLLLVIASTVLRVGKRYALPWGALSIIFAFLSLDEAVLDHGYLTLPLSSSLNAGGLFLFTWVIPAGVLMIIFALAFLGFLLNLPVKARRLFMLAGTLYVFGAVGMEMLGGLLLFQSNEFPGFWYGVLSTVEEFLEMVGIIIFLYALMRYMELSASNLQVE